MTETRADRRDRSDGMAAIRPYGSGDRAALSDICLRTADGGGDATHLYRDRTLVGDVFAVPYAELAADLAFVLDDGERAVGYVVGTADTTRFAARLRAEWLPLVGGRHPAPVGPPLTREQETADFLHHPERMVRPELTAFPAHLHINLLPGHQRAGHGRRLLYSELDALRAAGAPALHLGVTATNAPALAFYARLGFAPIAAGDTGPITYLGRSTDTSAPH